MPNPIRYSPDYADQLLTIPFADGSIPIAEKLTELNEIGTVLCTALAREALIKRAGQHARIIRNSTVLACLPFLEQIARGQKVTSENGQSVAKNYCEIAEYAMAEGLYQGALAETKGALSEFCVNAVFNWGLANGQLHDNSYALPTPQAVDASGPNGYRTGTDIIFRRAGPRPRRYQIQVKSYRPFSTKKPSFRHMNQLAKLNSYAPDITVITPGDVVGPRDPELANAIILRAVILDNKTILSNGFRKTLTKLDEADG